MMALRVCNLYKRYKRREILKGISLQLEQREVVGLLGPNGAGKTTFFYSIVGLVRPDDGDILLDNQSITALPMHVRARLGIGYLPQEASIFRKLSVSDNIEAVLELRPEIGSRRTPAAVAKLAQRVSDRSFARCRRHQSFGR